MSISQISEISHYVKTTGCFTWYTCRKDWHQFSALLVKHTVKSPKNKKVLYWDSPGSWILKLAVARASTSVQVTTNKHIGESTRFTHHIIELLKIIYTIKIFIPFIVLHLKGSLTSMADSFFVSVFCFPLDWLKTIRLTMVQLTCFSHDSYSLLLLPPSNNNLHIYSDLKYFIHIIDILFSCANWCSKYPIRI